MEPNQNTNMQNETSVPTSTGVPNVSSTSLNMPDKSVESSNPGSEVVFRDKPKNNMGMILTIVLLVLLAVGGIGFGVWAMMDGSAQVAKKDEQIADLRSQLAEKNEVVEEDVAIEDTATDGDMGNPIISTASPAQYKVRYTIPVYVDSGTGNSFVVTIKDGNYESCGVTGIPTDDCVITGVPSGIYKAVTLYEGNGIGSEKVGFLMSDGSLWYVDLYEGSTLKKEMQAKKANVPGFVKDVVNVTYTSDTNSPTDGYGSTVLIMSDGSIMKYEDSLFQ